VKDQEKPPFDPVPLWARKMLRKLARRENAYAEVHIIQRAGLVTNVNFTECCRSTAAENALESDPSAHAGQLALPDDTRVGSVL